MLGGGLSLLFWQVWEGVGLRDVGDRSRLVQRMSPRFRNPPVAYQRNILENFSESFRDMEDWMSLM